MSAFGRVWASRGGMSFSKRIRAAMTELAARRRAVVTSIVRLGLLSLGRRDFLAGLSVRRPFMECC